MAPTHDSWTGYDSFWAADPPPAEPTPAGGADAYAAFVAATE
jgi:hypothetical protein